MAIASWLILALWLVLVGVWAYSAPRAKRYPAYAKRTSMLLPYIL